MNTPAHTRPAVYSATNRKRASARRFAALACVLFWLAIFAAILLFS